MVVAPHAIVVLAHDVRKGVADVATLNDRARLAGLPQEEKEGEDDAAGEYPLADGEGDLERGGRLGGVRLKDRVGPAVRGEQGDGGVHVGDVHRNGLDAEDPEPQVLETGADGVGSKVLDVDEIKLACESAAAQRHVPATGIAIKCAGRRAAPRFGKEAQRGPGRVSRLRTRCTARGARAHRREGLGRGCAA